MAHGFYELSKKGSEKIKKIIRDKHSESMYAFVPDKQEAKCLMGFARDPNYRQVLMLVPRYRYIDLLRTGLLIDYYHQNNTLSNRKRVSVIKLQISKRPNGKKLLKIANLPTTPFFSIILQRLLMLKQIGYDSEFLEEELDELVQDWEKSAKLVENHEKSEDIVDYFLKKVSENCENCFILGMRSASKIIDGALFILTDKGLLEKNGYDYKLTKSTMGNNPRTELMIFRSS